MSEDLTEIKVSTARIEEQIKSLTSSMAAQHANLSNQIKDLASKDSLADVHDRVTKLEDTQSWVVKGILASFITAIGAAAGIGKKMGL